MISYRKFKVEKMHFAHLSVEDKSILEILEVVVRDVAKIYEIQLKEGFYPKTISKDRLEQVGKEYHGLLSPFTYIKGGKDKFEVIPYHVRYAQFLKPIAKKIERAAVICTNKSFKNYLKARAKSLLDGSFREADVIWLSVKNSNLDFSIGPFERYLDKAFFIKRVFQAHVGIIDHKYTQLAEQYKETLYSWAKTSERSYHSTEIPKKGVGIFIEVTPIISGYAADVLFSGEHFPCDLDIALEHGSKTIIYASQLTFKFEKLYYPIFKAIFEKRFASKYSKQLLLEASGWTILLYELGKQLHQFEGARERLKELYGVIDEANAFASGIEHSKHLVVKGLISEELLEAIIIIHILWMFADWIYYLQNKHKESHVIGNSMLLNYYLSMGALKESEGISWPNFSKIFFGIESMANILASLLQKGSYQDADKLIKKLADFKSFEKFSKHLTQFSPRV